MTCRLPIECLRRLAARKVAPDAKTLHRLVVFCVRHVRPVAAPWTFAPDIGVELPAGASASLAERALATWGLTAQPDWSWHLDPQPHPWRREQEMLLARIAELRPNAIGLVEASTGVGKTRVFASAAATNISSCSVVIAVPTRTVGRIWQQTWALFSDVPLVEVWGKSQYGSDPEAAAVAQTAALEAASLAHAVLCTHQMIPKVVASRPGSMLLVDEAHLLSAAMASLAGRFVPAAAAGRWVQRWCDQQPGLGGDAAEIELGGRMRAIVVERLVPLSERSLDWRVGLLVSADSEPLIWLRHGLSVDRVWADLWRNVGQALLFSGTLSWLTSSGSRTIHHLSRRLQLPPDRLQDLGRVWPSWRDEGVTVYRPARHVGADNRPWLGAYRGREEFWWPEAAAALLALRKRAGKTLVLATSYRDIEGVRTAMGRVAGVVVSQHGDTVEAGQKQLARKAAWCWLATGSAWTGMDTTLQRVVILKLPLPDPLAMRLLAQPQDAVFDAVSRFRQGVGRLVRAAGGRNLEIFVLDGRINDVAPRWRSICQPFLQVLGEEFEHHELLEPENAEDIRRKPSDLSVEN